MLFWIDQIISYLTIIAGWWIIHQTGHVPFSWSSFLMRLGVAGFTTSLVFITLLRFVSIPTPYAGPIFKTFLFIMFFGISLFHYRRFGKL